MDISKRVFEYMVNKDNFTNEEIEEILVEEGIKPRHKIVILNQDETERMEIDENDIEASSVAFSEQYQQGSRRSLDFTLINRDGKYTPSPNIQRERFFENSSQKIKYNLYEDEIWGDMKFRYYMGLDYHGKEIWFRKGIYVVNKLDVTSQDSDKKINFSLGDKFTVFEGKQGTLMDTYEIPVGSNAIDALKDLFKMPTGNGYNLDNTPILFDTRFRNFKIQATIRKEAGDTVSSLIADIATQLSANYYYNENGNFILEYLNETITDDVKPTCWQYFEKNYDLLTLNSAYDFTNAINVVKVVGDNVNNGIYSYLMINNDARSPICVGKLGYRKEAPITNCNIWDNTMAKELARYYLRKKSLVPLSFNATAKFNPLLFVDFLCTIDFEKEDMKFKGDKCVINSISVNSSDNVMNLTLTKVEDLTFINAGGGYNGF